MYLLSLGEFLGRYALFDSFVLNTFSDCTLSLLLEKSDYFRFDAFSGGFCKLFDYSLDDLFLLFIYKFDGLVLPLLLLLLLLFSFEFLRSCSVS